jgi:preprotein translocase subunit YajC
MMALLATLVFGSAEAFAQTAPGAQAPVWMQMAPFIPMIAIFYFLIWRPQQKREKTRQGFISQMKRGDEVVTSTGMFGRIEGLTDQFVTLEISDGVRVKMLRSSISTSVQAITQAAAVNAEAKGGKA